MKASKKVYLTPQQQEAKSLFEAGIILQKQIAEKVKVSEKTIGDWIVKFGWLRETELDKKKTKAKLLVQQGMTQKEASQAIDVSEKTLGKWCKTGQWHAQKKIIYPHASQVEYVIIQFAAWSKQRNVIDYETLHAELKEFLLKKEL